MDRSLEAYAAVLVHFYSHHGKIARARVKPVLIPRVCDAYAAAEAARILRAPPALVPAELARARRQAVLAAAVAERKAVRNLALVGRICVAQPQPDGVEAEPASRLVEVYLERRQYLRRAPAAHPSAYRRVRVIGRAAEMIGWELVALRRLGFYRFDEILRYARVRA